MSGLINSISTLDELVDALLERIQGLESKNRELEGEVRSLQLDVGAAVQKLNECEGRLNALRLANGLMGGEHKAETKLKINTLIREIDHCIAQLSE